MNRRHFLRAAGVGLIATTFKQRASAQTSPRLTPFVDQLPIPSVLRPSPGPNTIGMTQFQVRLQRNHAPTTVCESNSSFPGPTIETRRGSPIQITWQNNLPQRHIFDYA